MKFAVLAALSAQLAAAQTECTLTVALYTDDKCTEAPDGNEAEMKTTGGCDKFDPLRDIWFADPVKMGEEGAKNMLAGTGGLFPGAVKHACSGTEVVTKYFSDEKCETEMASLKKTTKWGDCYGYTADGKTQYITIAGASALKAAAAAVMALAATQF